MFRRIPSKRALAALVKFRGRRLEKRWPFLPRAERKDLNLTFEDVLEFQYARTRHFTFLIVGAYDGLTNDPISRFVRSHPCTGILVEPQPAVYERLRANLCAFPQFQLLNAAVDEVSGTRTMYTVPAGNHDLPEWTEQIASFQREHVEKHEAHAPGVIAAMRSQEIPAISFDDLLDRFHLRALDVLQIDAEGMDAQLLRWFPFQRIKPGVLHYETVHLQPEEHSAIRSYLTGLGYFVTEADSPSDDMAVLLH